MRYKNKTVRLLSEMLTHIRDEYFYYDEGKLVPDVEDNDDWALDKASEIAEYVTYALRLIVDAYMVKRRGR